MFWLVLDWVVIVALHVLGVIAGIHALLNKRDSRSALGWMVVCVAVPGLGALAYLIFGMNRIANVARQWESRGLWHMGQTDMASVTPGDIRQYAAGFDAAIFDRLVLTGDRVCRRPLVPGCHIEILQDGTEAYPQMLAAIHNAKQNVYLCSYIFGSSGVGQDFINALADATARGLDVRVLIDGIGGLYCWPTAAYKLRKRGVRVSYFLPLLRNWYYTLHLNLRNHRKILVVDGRLGFTGGLNIHENNMAGQGQEALIHDLHFHVTGPIVGYLQDIFLKGWYFSTREHIQKVFYYDDSPKGDMLCRAIPDGPHQQYALLQNILVAALGAAKSHIRIMTPYFVLGNTMRSAFNAAAFLGVNIEVILPESNNLRFVKGAVESLLPGLLQRGVTIYYRRGNFAHTKLFLVDDFVAYIGSSNLDMRSLHLNFEFNLEVFSQPLVAQLITHFETVKRQSWQITQTYLDNQGFWLKLRNAFFKLFSPYL